MSASVNKENPRATAILFCRDLLISQGVDGLKSAINIFANIRIALPEGKEPAPVRLQFFLIVILENIKTGKAYSIDFKLSSPSGKELLADKREVKTEGAKSFNHAEITKSLDIVATEEGEYLLTLTYQEQIIGRATLPIYFEPNA